MGKRVKEMEKKYFSSMEGGAVSVEEIKFQEVHVQSVVISQILESIAVRGTVSVPGY